MNELFGTGAVRPEEIILDPVETAARLKTRVTFSHALIAACKAELFSCLEVRYAYAVLPVEIRDNICSFGRIAASSQDLANRLDGCHSAFLFAVTTGFAVDRLIAKNTALSAAKGFITDGLASAAAEAAADVVDIRLRGENAKPARFSPGYGDLALSTQREVLDLLDAQRQIGITLNRSLLMTPAKSITAFAGIQTR